MSDDKILTFDASTESPPSDPDAILKVLKQIPNEIIFEYDTSVKNYLDEKLLFNSILITVDNPSVCKHLLSKLNHDQLDKFCKLITCLASNDVLEKIPEVISHGMDIRVPTSGILSKAAVLLKLIKATKSNHKIAAAELIRLSDLYQRLKTYFWVFEIIENLENSESYLIDRLSLSSERDLDRMIEIISSTVVVNNQRHG